ncbi:hypothetical protein MHBO_002068 [Bonamia ostreae]|uniref:G-patch domain-containing protein n=1 Tax=Bonamia ostreae TaxID=126728 RepID=A0ABV2AM61_9EUKA
MSDTKTVSALPPILKLQNVPRTTKKTKSVSFATGTKEKDAEGPNKYHITTKYRPFAVDSVNSESRFPTTQFGAVLGRPPFELYDPAAPNEYEDYCKAKKERLMLKRHANSLSRINEAEKSSAAEEKSAEGGDVFSNSFAEKMMKKMGWEEGKGLGKSQQGISSYLVPSGRFNRLSEADKRTSSCMCIVNMASRNQMDSFLKEETMMECAKFGKVVECVVYVNPDHFCSVEEEVTIYVQFQFDVDCERAVLAMDGRFFGGRKLRCYFFDLNRFLRRDFSE